MIASPVSDTPVPRICCTFCNDPLDVTRRAYCTDCRAPHHEDCYRWIRHCAAPRCGGLRFDHGRRVHLPIEVVDFPLTPPARLAARPDLLEKASRMRRARESSPTRRIVLEAGLDPVKGVLFQTDARHMLPWLIAAFAGSFLLPVELLVPWITLCATLGVLEVMRGRPPVDRYVVFDGPSRSVMLHASQPGKALLSPVGPFEDIDRIRIRHREEDPVSGYSLALDLRDGRHLDLSESLPEDSHGCPEELRERADLLAGLTGAPVESRRLA